MDGWMIVGMNVLFVFVFHGILTCVVFFSFS
jgi:hypothetical protein